MLKIAKQTVQLLKNKKLNLSIAESCTGGMVSQVITSISGASKVFKFAIRRMSDVSTKLLKENGLSGTDVDLFIPHQANKRIIEATGERCGIPKDKVMINIDKYGNTTAGTIPIALNEAVEKNLISDGDYVLLSAFGSGFTWGSILIKWNSKK